MSAQRQLSVEQLQEKLKKAITKSEKHIGAIDWESRKQWWIDKIQKFYADIELWCKPADIQIQKYNMSLQEEFLGVYPTEKLALSAGKVQLFFVPVGCTIIGGLGRVDMLCGSTTLKLILVEKGTRPGVRFSIINGNAPALDLPRKNPQPDETEWLVIEDWRSRSCQQFTGQYLLEFIMKKMGA